MDNTPDLLGDASFWGRALSSLQKVAPNERVPTGPKARRAPRIPATEDPLGITILGPGAVIRPQPGEGCDFKAVESIAELREYLRPAFEQRIPFGADWETDSLNPTIAHPVGLSVSVDDKSGRYVPVQHMIDPESNLPLFEVIQVLQELDALGVFSIWYNAGYDLEVTARSTGWEPRNWHDAQIAVFLVNSNVIELNLKSTALRLLGRKMQGIEDLDEEWALLTKKARKERRAKLPHELPSSRVAPYGCDDACCTRAIWMHPAVQKAIADQALIFQIEEWLVPVMREGNAHGVYMDAARLRELQTEVKARLAELTPQIYTKLGCTEDDFKLSQRQPLGKKLFELKAIGYIETNPKSAEHGAWTVERTQTGEITTSKKVFDKYRKQHPVIPDLIEYAELEAQERSYLRKLLKAVEHFNEPAQMKWSGGRVRFAFNSIGVPTGRMKCGGAGKAGMAYAKGVADVNAQSLPDHEKAPYLPNTRSAIVAPPGYVVLAADYSQIELRIPANLAKEQRWIDAFLKGEDIHLTTAQVITNVREPGVVVLPDDKKRRGGAKATNFALLYGGDAGTISRNAGIPLDESQQIVDAYFKGLPALERWVRTTQASARAQKLVRTFLGRIRHLEQYFLPEPSRKDFQLWKKWKKLDSQGCREAINDPIQGGAADIFKLACIRLRWAIQEKVRSGEWPADIISTQVFWVHDEVVFYVKQEWVTRVVPVLRIAMEFPVEGWPVPLKTEFEVGSRKLYAESKVSKVTKALAALGAAVEDEATRTQLTAEHDRWARIAALPDISNYGELVELKYWVARYAPDASAAA